MEKSSEHKYAYIWRPDNFIYVSYRGIIDLDLYGKQKQYAMNYVLSGELGWFYFMTELSWHRRPRINQIYMNCVSAGVGVCREKNISTPKFPESSKGIFWDR